MAMATLGAPDPEAIVEEMSFVESPHSQKEVLVGLGTSEDPFFDPFRAQGLSDREYHILASIAGLRAYALLAHKPATTFIKQHSGANTALVNLLLSMGKPAPEVEVMANVAGTEIDTGEKKKIYNVIVDYAKSMHQTKQTFHKGIGLYMAKKVDQLLTSGRKWSAADNRFGCLEVHDHKVMFKFKAVGLAARPAYFKRLAVPLPQWQVVLGDVMRQAQKSDVSRNIKRLGRGWFRKYKQLLKSHTEEEDRHVRDFKRKAYDAALAKIQKSFKSSIKNGDDPMAVASAAIEDGKDAVRQIAAPTVKSDAVIVKETKAENAAWQDAQTLDSNDLTAGIKNVEQAPPANISTDEYFSAGSKVTPVHHVDDTIPFAVDDDDISPHLKDISSASPADDSSDSSGSATSTTSTGDISSASPADDSSDGSGSATSTTSTGGSATTSAGASATTEPPASVGLDHYFHAGDNGEDSDKGYSGSDFDNGYGGSDFTPAPEVLLEGQ